MPDLFRFSVTRGTEAVEVNDTPAVLRPTPSSFRNQLADARQSGDAFGEMRKLARSFVAGGDAETGFVTGLAALDPGLAEFEGIGPGQTGFAAAVEAIAGRVSSETLEAWITRVEDSLAAALVLSDENGAARALDRARRLLGAVKARKDRGGETEAARAFGGTVLLDSAVFPVPASLAHRRAAAAALAQRRKAQEVRQEARDKLVEEIRNNQIAMRELTRAYDGDYQLSLLAQGNLPPPQAFGGAPATAAGFLSRLFGTGPEADRLEPTPSTKLGVLSADAAAGLSETGKKVVERFSDPSEINVPLTLGAIERRNETVANTLYSGGLSGRAVTLAGGFTRPGTISDAVLVDDFDVHVPGACPLKDEGEGELTEPSVPSGVGEILSIGVSDLMVTRQRLLRYELGEIAHIENVMKSEKRSREHRSLTRREERVVTESEVTEENERDLQTTERFELQTESEKTIQEDASRQAGVTLTGSYGPSVDFSANVGFASTSSKSNSISTATAHAREIVDRSVNKIQERVRRERTTVTVNEVEVINSHAFENTAPEAEHISGIYRWVDKIYEAQVYNYGRRELIEVVVPEPAALLRYLTTSAPREGITVPRPMDPGYCTGSGYEFEALEPKHLNSVSALFWASVYNVAGITAPPPRFQVLGVALSTKTDEEHPKEALSDNSLRVPSGYAARRGVFKGNKLIFEGQTGAGLEVYVGRHLAQPSQLVTLNGEAEVVPIAVLSARSPAFAGTVEIECERTPEHYADWQAKTYNLIMAAYEERRAAYDAALADLEADAAGPTVRGRNPAVNREIERRELKRGAISQITGQHFDDFDAMRKAVGAEGFPQADVAEARREGQYILFLEQAFEWENMQYLFYPYFWGRKADWPVSSQITDVDPLFEAFLGAGAARVNVPVRPGFEAAANAYLSTGQLPWTAESDAPTVAAREPFISIADEMKAQSGAIDVKSGGRVTVATGVRQVTGTGTDFTDDDVDREITLGGDVYMIASVENSGALTLRTDYAGVSLQDAVYSIGAKAVGVPWTVRIPTLLVKLQAGADLPDLTAAESGGAFP